MNTHLFHKLFYKGLSSELNRCENKAEDVRNDLDKYKSVSTELAEKQAERDELYRIKKKTPNLFKGKHKELDAKMYELGEDISELMHSKQAYENRIRLSEPSIDAPERDVKFYEGKVAELKPQREETFALDSNHNIIKNAAIDTENGVVTVDGVTVENATIVAQGDVLGSYKRGSSVLNSDILADSEISNISDDERTGTVLFAGQEIPVNIVTEQFVPMGPAASQVAIKQSGTNGGGFMGVNSAHPLENPNAFTNLIEMISILLIPAALCFTFGKAVKNKKQGIAIFMAMFICLVIALGTIAVNEQLATPQLAQNGAVDISMIDQAGGNMEGKETRFGIATSSTWAAFTTAASNGSVNSMHDSYTPIGGMATMLLMQLGEVIFGGTGCGLYGMLAFAILTVFIAGLMVGRTPEFLGKKIEPYEMKWAVLVCLATPIVILVGSGIAVVWPTITESLNNSGTHGLSEILYAYSSAGGNNGSAFAGFNANTVFLNLSLAFVILFARFLPIVGTLAIAGSLAKKKMIATTAGTLSTTNAMFVFLLIFIVLLIGALSFFPALALGPIAEFFQSIM